MGENEGLALLQKTRGYLPASEAARLFRMSHLYTEGLGRRRLLTPDEVLRLSYLINV